MNVGTLLTKAAQNSGQKLGIAQGSKNWTYDQFNGRANQLANALGTLGVKRGSHVALLMYNGPQMLESMFATFKAGCGAVPINFRLHPDEIAFIINHSEAKVVIASPEFNDALRSLKDRIPHVSHAITLSQASGTMLDYDSVLAAASEQFDDVAVDPDDVAWMFYTSGTTGQPKGAMLTHRNLLAMSLSAYVDFGLAMGADEVVVHVAPLSHGSGLYAVPNVGKSAAHIFPESKTFEPRQVLEIIEKYHVTNMFAAPAIVMRLINAPDFDQYDLSSLKAIVYGGAPILVEDLVKAIEKLGPCLANLYGQGESPMTITCLPQREHVLDGSDDQLKRLRSVGYAHVNVEVEIVDEHDNKVVPGEMGEIITRSDVVMKGYWRNPEATAETLRNGWLHTGDLGYMDEAGYVYLMARSKDLIISGGENIYAVEIEQVLIQHPAVREVAVIGVPDAEWGEVVKAIVSTLEGAAVTETELIAFCKDHIASYKKPKSVAFVAELPKNNYGKILKKELRASYGGEGIVKNVDIDC